MSIKKFFKGKKVLVAGGSGFVGRNFVEKLLALNCKVISTVHKRKLNLKHKNLKQVNCNLTDLNDCIKLTKNCEIVINAAGMVSAAQMTVNNPMSAISTNLIITLRILEACMLNNPQKILLFSSGTTGYPGSSKTMKESDMFKNEPADVYFGYGWSRRYTELLGKFVSMKTNIDIAICRPSAVYGIYDDFNPKTSHVIPALIKRAVDMENPYVVWGSGNEKRDFIYVEDLVEGCLQQIKAVKKYDVTNICYGSSVSIKKVVNSIFDILKYKKDRIIFDEKKPTTIPIRKLSNIKAIKDFNFTPKYSIYKGLEKTISWYIKNHV